ncbi:hypothetical protein K461DRAFT_298212 [Myriangium duriaei CBS 260.36]|uniref:Uncharacterized protein n=1 Tax=Myriangium duriaei CBS 260.36 TaxID=1168546 RepID=A0A9P4MHQ6_9PEZI|nr:hypothetical protein K461DRAFT_298212 [Myriangium duriaei CBS 260.36]
MLNAKAIMISGLLLATKVSAGLIQYSVYYDDKHDNPLYVRRHHTCSNQQVALIHENIIEWSSGKFSSWIDQNQVGVFNHRALHDQEDATKARELLNEMIALVTRKLGVPQIA